jgi:hypothetical protein
VFFGIMGKATGQEQDCGQLGPCIDWHILARRLHTGSQSPRRLVFVACFDMWKPFSAVHKGYCMSGCCIADVARLSGRSNKAGCCDATISYVEQSINRD